MSEADELWARIQNTQSIAVGKQMQIAVYTNDGEEVEVPIKEDSVSISPDEETSDDTPAVSAPLEYHGFSCTLPGSRSMPIETGVTVVMRSTPNRPIRRINVARYEQMLRSAHSIRKKKKYAKALGYKVTVEGNVVEYAYNERLLYIPRCELIATIDPSTYNITINATALES